MGPGANRLSLMAAQAAFVPPWPAPDFHRDPQWRPLDPTIDTIEVPIPGVEYGATYPDDRTYYWYWRRD